jgi:hypothetical protein
LTEDSSRPVLAEAAAETDRSRQEIVARLSDASQRLRKLQGLSGEPILLDGDQVEVARVAGLIRVGPGLELEVAPKFLGAENPGWREDFFRIANLARRGWILPHEDIGAGRGRSNDLASLVGRVMITLFKQEERRPIRVYRGKRWDAFEIDGDLDEESVFLPGEAGFRQEKTVLERGNRYNEIVAEAARLLVSDVEDQDVRGQLRRMHTHLSPQRRPRSIAAAPARVPSRHQRWQQLYDISRAVVAGFGIDFASEEAAAPGFVVKTWSAWEDLLHLALRTGLRGASVEAQQRHRLGRRNGEDFGVTPDGTVSGPDTGFLWDAKYKAEWERGRRRISATDVYEANAFLEAAEVARIALLYPRLASEPSVACGSTDRFETVELSAGLIHGISVEARGISATGGFQRFATNLAGEMRAALDVPVLAEGD